MENKHDNERNSSIADAIIGGVFGVTVGWFYKRKEAQMVLERIKESEVARNIASDVYKSAEKNLKDFALMSIEQQRKNLFQNINNGASSLKKNSSSNNSSATSDEEENSNENNEKSTSSKKGEKSYEALKAENKRLEKMITNLEKKFEDIS